MKSKLISGTMLLLLGLTVAVYARPLFSQHFSAVHANLRVLTIDCTKLWSSPQTVAPGSSGALYFGCATSGCSTSCKVAGVAVTVANDGKAIPTYTLSKPYTAVALLQPPFPNPPTAGCTMPTGNSVLRSGTAFSFTGPNGKGNSFYYCVAYTNAGTGLPTFKVSWSQ